MIPLDVTHNRLTELKQQYPILKDFKAALLKTPIPAVGVHTLSPVEHFNVNSSALRVTDPCYDMDTWCAGTLEHVKNGKWAAFVDTSIDETDVAIATRHLTDDVTNLPDEIDSDLNQFTIDYALREIIQSQLHLETLQGRVNYIHIYHVDYPLVDIDQFEQSSIDVGVDSGQAGFFDLEWFKSNQIAHNGNKYAAPEWEAFYDALCEKTRGQYQFGANDHGALSASGWGDGSYTCHFKRNDEGEVVAARITFLYPDEEDNEE